MKNPAVLWYPSDFISSTIFWTNEQCGAYIRLLNYQFTVGHMTKKEMLQITNDPIVLKKFVKDEQKKYYNLRMENEINKRNSFIESRKNNGSKGGRPKNEEKTTRLFVGYARKNLLENENINKNININNNNYIYNNINIYNYYENNINTINNTTYNKLTNYINTINGGLIIKAIDIAVENNVRKFSYIDAILQNWIRSGYKTVEDIKDKKDTKNPSWLNEKIEEQEMTKEELEELEKDFSKYK